MKNLKLYLLIIVSSLIGFVLLFLKIFGIIQPAGQAINAPDQLETTSTVSQMPNEDQTITSDITLKVDYGNGETLSFTTPYQQDSTAFSVLQDALQKDGIDLETQSYDFGVFVRSINGLESSQDMSWIYFVNDRSGNVAADTYTLDPGDHVEWKYIAPSEN